MRINVKNTQEVQKALDEVQKRCSQRTLDANDITNFITKAEEKLISILPKKYWQGVRVAIFENFGGRVPSSYKGMPMATEVTLERGSKDWFIIDIKRLYASTSGHVQFLNLHMKKDEIVAFLQKKF